MGKHSPHVHPMSTRDYVIVLNVDKVVFTGKQWDAKRYTWYTGYTSAERDGAGAICMKPEAILHDAVRRMLPKNKLARCMPEKLAVLRTGTSASAQRLEAIELGGDTK